MKKYAQQLYGHIRSFVGSHDETDDILQNTFVKAWRALPNFREESKLYTWLYKIATNESITYLRSKKKNIALSLDDEQTYIETPTEEPNFLFHADEITQKLRQAIDNLPEKQRVVFNMKYFDEMKYEDMSEILGTSIGALKASYHFAVKKIQNYLATV